MKTTLLSALIITAGLATQANAGVILSPLDPTLVDTTYLSANSDNQALINFVNNSAVDVDVYWIDFTGERVAYYLGLLAGDSYSQFTYLTHPWLIIETGTGGTTTQGTGNLLTAFLPVTDNPTWDIADADTAYVVQAVPEASSMMIPLIAFGVLVCLQRNWGTRQVVTNIAE